jgi:phospholipid/cholesterol/gamma-HCH transport system substrate-binding protein
MNVRNIRRARTALLVLVVLVFAGRFVAHRRGSGGPTYAAVFANASDLVRYNDVRINDVKVGQVKSVTTDGVHARVRFQVAKDVRLPAATRAEVRQASLLGEKFVALVPEGSGRLPDGGIIPLERTRRQGEFETVVGVAGSLAGALSADNVNGVVGAFDGAFGGHPERLTKLVDETAAATATMNEHSAELVQTIDRVDQMTAAMAPHTAELAASLDQLARGMDALAGSSKDIGRFTAGLGGFSDRMAAILNANQEKLVASGPKLTQVFGEIASNTDSIASSLQGLYDFNASWACIGDGDFLNVTFVLLPEAASMDYGPGHCDPEKGQRSRTKQGQLVVEGVPETSLDDPAGTGSARPAASTSPTPTSSDGNLGWYLAWIAGGAAKR